jgi:hypothetical protein
MAKAKPEEVEPVSSPVDAGEAQEGVTNRHIGDKAEVARVLAWRKQHPDRYRETQRNLMRKRRAKPVDPAPDGN